MIGQQDLPFPNLKIFLKNESLFFIDRALKPATGVCCLGAAWCRPASYHFIQLHDRLFLLRVGQQRATPRMPEPCSHRARMLGHRTGSPSTTRGSDEIVCIFGIRGYRVYKKAKKESSQFTFSVFFDYNYSGFRRLSPQALEGKTSMPTYGGTCLSNGSGAKWGPNSTLASIWRISCYWWRIESRFDEVHSCVASSKYSCLCRIRFLVHICLNLSGLLIFSSFSISYLLNTCEISLIC